MNTKRTLFLICIAALSFTASLASAATHASQMMTRSAVTRSAPRFAPRAITGAHRFRNDGDNDRDDRFRRFHNRTFVFFDTFGFPFFYPYPYYGYYPYDYYGYNNYGYGNAYTVVEVQRRLARAGYTIMVPSTGSWGLKRDEQFVLTNATTICLPMASSIGSFSRQ